MSTSPIAIARAFYDALTAKAHGDALRPYLTDDVVVVEHPSLVKPHGATSGLEAMLAASSAGAGLLAWQRYDVVSANEVGALAILRAVWSGEVARDVGPFMRGQVLTAHIAQFIETRDGRIARIETYDCYAPFSRG